MTTAEIIAAHRAKHGVTKVAVGENSGITDRQWYSAARGRIDLNETLGVRDAEKAAERERERFAEARHMGVSQDLAYRYATGQVNCLCCGDLPNGKGCK